MSVKISGKVWDMKLTPSEKLVLLALADHADHNGKNAYPGNDLIAWKTELSNRQVRRILDELESRAVIKKAKGGVGRGQKTYYEFNLEKMTPRPLLQSEKGDTTSTYLKGEKGTPRPLNVKQKGDIGDTEKGTLATQKGDIPRARAEERARMNRPEPSIEPAAACAREVAAENLKAENTNGNGAKSKYTEATCREYVDYLVANGRELINPGGLAHKIYLSGQDDTDIRGWLASDKKPAAAKHANQSKSGMVY